MRSARGVKLMITDAELLHYYKKYENTGLTTSEWDQMVKLIGRKLESGYEFESVMSNFRVVCMDCGREVELKDTILDQDADDWVCWKCIENRSKKQEGLGRWL